MAAIGRRKADSRFGRRFAAVSALVVAATVCACSDRSTRASAPSPAATSASSGNGSANGAASGRNTTGSSANVRTSASVASAPPTTAPGAPAIQHVSAIAGGVDNNVYDTTLSTLEAGPVELTLTNRGTVEHQAMLIRLGDGVDLAQFTLQTLADPTRLSLFRLAQGFGGPNAVFPNGSASTTQVLTPGNYAMVCFLPGTGLPHAAQGMVRAFTVTAPRASTPASLPSIVDEPRIQLSEWRFVAPPQLRAGQTVRVVNTGQQTHELGFYRLEGNATPQELVAAFERADPNPPTSGGAGLGGLRPGGEAQFVVPSRPGTYALVSFFPDTSGSGKTDVHLGMLSQITVN